MDDSCVDLSCTIPSFCSCTSASKCVRNATVSSRMYSAQLRVSVSR